MLSNAAQKPVCQWGCISDVPQGYGTAVFEKKFYYAPAKQISESKLPIHYVALYQTNKMFEGNGQIRYYGEAIRVALMKRASIKELPVERGNGEELYNRI